MVTIVLKAKSGISNNEFREQAKRIDDVIQEHISTMVYKDRQEFIDGPVAVWIFKKKDESLVLFDVLNDPNVVKPGFKITWTNAHYTSLSR